jgi:uncharacterized protein (TIGR00661 family)
VVGPKKRIDTLARILLGIMGDAGGHISQALAVAEAMPQHEFLLVGGGRVPALAQEGYTVAEVRTFQTYYTNNRVDLFTTAWKGLGTVLQTRRIVNRVARIAKEFDPQLVISAYEFSVPLAARRLGIPSVTIDNHHFLNKCICDLPRGQAVGRWTYGMPLRFCFSNTDFFLVSAFYDLKPRNPETTVVLPAVLRQTVLAMKPKEEDHVVVYQSSPTFKAVSTILEQIPRRFHIYGFGERPAYKNLVYKAPSTKGFLEDMASCAYVITNGGHNVIAEALYLGKPVLSFPIRFAYEQFFNAHMLKTLGYGDYCLEAEPGRDILERFEARREEFRTNIRKGTFCGNDQAAAYVNRLIESQTCSRAKREA